MTVNWEDSGKGPVEISLADAQHLAVKAGFVFPADDTAPLSKRANLQKMFEHFGVNSLSAFKTKFSAYQLDPSSKHTSDNKQSWTSQRQGGQEYIGQILGGKRHGVGILLEAGSTAPILYVGSFQEGLRNGYGAVLTPRGETFHGFFKDDVMWGPGSYTFPRPPSEAQAVKHRVRFEGMHNGRPAGKGRMVWSDGACEHGEFQGHELMRAVPAQDCSGVLLVSESNAEVAKRVVAEVELELKRQELWEGEGARLFAVGMQELIAKRAESVATLKKAHHPGCHTIFKLEQPKEKNNQRYVVAQFSKHNKSSLSSVKETAGHAYNARMSDDFEKAVLFSFDQTGSISSELKAQAQAMLQSAAQSPDAWQLCVSRMESSTYAEVKFWCLQTLHAVVCSPAYAGALQKGARDQIKRTLVSAGGGPTSSRLPPFLRNKVAQTIVAIAAQEYPDEWPTFFQDLLSTLSQGPEAVDLFCRILVAVDEDIVSLDMPRSAEEAKQSMRFKDSMRDLSLPDVALAWCQLVAAYKDSSPETTAAVLDAVQRYVHWIDISLVANDAFVPLLFSVLNSPEEAPRSAAAGVLTEIVAKRMEAGAKLNLIQTLGVVPVCAQWATTGLPGVQDGDQELAVKFSKLLAALATEVLESWKKIENSVLSMAAVGLDVTGDAAAEATASCTSAAQLLDALFPAVLTALRTGDDEIAAAVGPFLLSYVGRVRMLQKRAGGVVPPEAATQLPSIQESLAACARFADESSVYALSASNAVENVEAEEEENAVAMRRQELFAIFRNAAKLAPAESYALVGRRLEAALGRADAPWQDAELALSLLYQLGEGASDDALKFGSGPLASLAAAVVQADVPAAGHRLVATALLESCSRYAKVYQQQPALVLRAVSLFLGPTGLGHPSEAVPPRAAYLFCRLAKTLRSQMRQMVPDVLRSLQPHLAAIAATPKNDTGTLAKAAGASSIIGALGSGVSAADDRLYAFEAAALLIGLEDLSEETQLEYLWAVLQPLIHQLETNVGGGSGRVGSGEGADINAGVGVGGQQQQQQQQKQQQASSIAVPLLQQAIDALTRASKGFAPRLCTETRPKVGAMLVKPLGPAMQAVQQFPGHKLLRSKFLAYVHRLVECLGSGMVGHLSSVLWALQQPGDDAGDFTDVLALLNQMIARFKTDAMTSLIKAAAPDCIVKVHFLLTPEWDWSGVKAMPAMGSSPMSSAAVFSARTAGPAPVGSTEDLRERGELQKAYYTFLNTLANFDLGQVLLGAPGDTLTVALNDLMAGAGTHVDPSVRKLCIATIGRFAVDWLAPAGEGAVSSGAGGGGGVDKAPTSPAVAMPASLAGGPAHGGAIVAGLGEFLIQKFGGEILLEGLATPGCGVDIRDAAAISLLTEVAMQLKAMHKLGGQAFLAHICGVTLPKLGWPAAAQEQLVAHITQSETKQLKDFLKAALLELRQNGGVPAGR